MLVGGGRGTIRGRMGGNGVGSLYHVASPVLLGKSRTLRRFAAGEGVDSSSVSIVASVRRRGEGRPVVSEAKPLRTKNDCIVDPRSAVTELKFWKGGMH